MYFFPIFRFGVRVVRNIQKDLAFCAKHLRLVWIGVIALSFFLMTFDFIKGQVGFFRLPLIMFIVGLTVTKLPFYVVLALAFLSPEFLIPMYIIYFIGFVWMFLV